MDMLSIYLSLFFLAGPYKESHSQCGLFAESSHLNINVLNMSVGTSSRVPAQCHWSSASLISILLY